MIVVFMIDCDSRTCKVPSIIKSPAKCKSAFNEASPFTTNVDAIVAIPVTPKVESIVVAPPTERAVFNDTSF